MENQIDRDGLVEACCTRVEADPTLSYAQFRIGWLYIAHVLKTRATAGKRTALSALFLSPHYYRVSSISRFIQPIHGLSPPCHRHISHMIK